MNKATNLVDSESDPFCVCRKFKQYVQRELSTSFVVKSFFVVGTTREGVTFLSNRNTGQYILIVFRIEHLFEKYY